MRGIRIDLGGVTVDARLLDEAAPVTSRDLWQRLPFTGRFEHSIWSGLMLHSPEGTLTGLDTSRYPKIENPVIYVEAGDVIVWPQDGSISIAYGHGQFRWLTTPWVVTKVAEIEGDLEALATEAYRAMFEGARSVTIDRLTSLAPLAEAALSEGARLVEIEYDGMTWVAELFDDVAPEYCRAVWESLPIEGPTSVTHSSGEVLHCWTTFRDPGTVPSRLRKIRDVTYRGRRIGGTYVSVESRTARGQQPGDLVWGANWNDLRIVYGQGRFGGDELRIGRIVRGDIAALAERARGVLRDGSKPITLRRYAPRAPEPARR